MQHIQFRYAEIDPNRTINVTVANLSCEGDISAPTRKWAWEVKPSTGDFMVV